MEFLTDLIASPFVLFGVLAASLTWWSWILAVIWLTGVGAYIYNDRDLRGFFLLMAAIVVFTFFHVETPEGLAWYQSLWEVVKTILVGMAQYLLIGLVAAIPLWLWHVRKELVELRTHLYEYVQQRAKARQLWRNPHAHRSQETLDLSEEQIAACQQYRVGGAIPEFLQENWRLYRYEEFGLKQDAFALRNNLDTASSYVFLWPFHYIIRFFGDFLETVVRTVLRYLGRFVDWLVNVVRIGIPSGIDK
ncbi:MAG: hypothetical protein KC877_00060 [Candidatus Kaiserbacteria bacterium]|nr:hypothetical protein [Candidatus Kaiserbacteria bacterium]MCB9816623.1 hypothetical protein [Candidatus Nomurabacteria bacterium]